MCNLAWALSAKWQGHAVERLGYPVTLGLDAVVGPVCLFVQPYVAAARGRAALPEGVVR